MAETMSLLGMKNLRAVARVEYLPQAYVISQRNIGTEF